MTEKLQLHNVDAITTSMDVVFENKRILTFKAFSEFESFNFDVESSPTKSIFIQWDFFVKLSSFSVHQRHTVSVRITSSLNPSDVFKIMLSGALDETSDIDMQCCTTLCKVDFINNTLAEELIAVVEQWNGLCESAYSKKGKFAQFLYTNAQTIADISAFFCCVTLCGIIAIVLKYLTSLNIISMTLNLFLCVSVTFIPLGLAVRGVGKKFASVIYYKFRQVMNIHLFHLSDGDKKIIARLERKSNYTKEILAFSLNILISFVISFLFWKL